MIPQDQHVPVGREVLGCPLNEASQSRRFCHRSVSGIFDQTLYLAFCHLIDLIDTAAYDVVSPLLAASRENYQVDLVGNVSADHFLQMLPKFEVNPDANPPLSERQPE